MTSAGRLTKRKLQVRRLLGKADPPGIALLNELRVRAFWDNDASENRLSPDDHRKSFTRTLIEHGEPFDVLDLSRSHRGIPKSMMAGIIARWSVWHFIERGLLTSIPSNKDIELCVGYDACSGIIPLANENYAVLGTTCRYRSLWIIADRGGLDRYSELAECPWKINGIVNGQDGNQLDEISGSTPLSSLAYLPSIARLSNGKEISMSKISMRY